MAELLTSILLIAGGVLTCAAGVGVLRLPNLRTRLHASTKAGGGAFLLLVFALLLQAPQFELAIKALLTGVLALLSLPLAAQALARHAPNNGKTNHNGT